MPTVIKENYMKALHFLNQESKAISLSQLGKAMGVSKPTANDMVKKLQAHGWLIYEKYKPLRLTEEGTRLAALIVRKHRLSEMFLCEVMGFGWEEVHDIAEQMEHIKSDRFFDRMDEILGFPIIDPHGSPIPDRDGHLNHAQHVLLSEIQVGTKVVLQGLRNSSTEFLKFLNEKSLRLGTEITLIKLENFDKSMVVSYLNNSKVTLSQSVTSKLLVEHKAKNS